MKKLLASLSQNLGVQPFVFESLGVMCVWLGSCVQVNAAPLNGDIEDPGPFVAFYAVQGGGTSPHVCVKLISPVQTIYLVIEHWPRGSSILSLVNLPRQQRGGVPRRGTGGTIFWADHSYQKILQYDRLHPTSEDRNQWRFARYLYELSKPLFRPPSPGRPKRVPAGAYEKQKAKGDTAARSMAKASAQICLGPGYLVNRFWIAADFSRVVCLGGGVDPWAVAGFTRKVLQVMLENGARPGLTSVAIYDRARALYVGEHPECCPQGSGQALVPQYKPVGQFFRLTRHRKRVDHPLYSEVEIVRNTDVTYVLAGERVEQDDPRLLVSSE